jgi:hypothetical protein
VVLACLSRGFQSEAGHRQGNDFAGRAHRRAFGSWRSPGRGNAIYLCNREPAEILRGWLRRFGVLAAWSQRGASSGERCDVSSECIFCMPRSDVCLGQKIAWSIAESNAAFWPRAGLPRQARGLLGRRSEGRQSQALVACSSAVFPTPGTDRPQDRIIITELQLFVSAATKLAELRAENMRSRMASSSSPGMRDRTALSVQEQRRSARCGTIRPRLRGPFSNSFD